MFQRKKKYEPLIDPEVKYGKKEKNKDQIARIKVSDDSIPGMAEYILQDGVGGQVWIQTSVVTTDIEHHWKIYRVHVRLQFSTYRESRTTFPALLELSVRPIPSDHVNLFEAFPQSHHHITNMSMYTSDAGKEGNDYISEAFWQIEYEAKGNEAQTMEFSANFCSPSLQYGVTFDVQVREKERLDIWRKIQNVPQWITWESIFIQIPP